MEVLINGMDQTADKLIVDCTSQFGNCHFKWIGKPCEVGLKYDIELDILPLLTWQKEIILLDHVEYFIREENGQVCIAGVFESLDDEGMVMLRVLDSIVAFITQGVSFEIGSCIQVTVDFVNAHLIMY